MVVLGEVFLEEVPLEGGVTVPDDLGDLEALLGTLDAGLDLDLDPDLYLFLVSSSDDDDKYRTQEERDGLKSLDCNLKFKTFLLEEGIIDETWLEKIETEHKEIVNQATKEAEKSPYPSPEETYTHVYEEGSSINA